MPAHLPRRSFATPFIVTVAAACGGSSDNIHANPPPPEPEPSVSAAPSAAPAPTETTPAPTASATPTPPPNTTYTIAKSGNRCTVSLDSRCPPNMKCNPPPPRDYACPAVVHDYPATLTVDAATHQCTVSIEPIMGPCPRGASCNPPPPRDEKVPCPR